MAQLNDTTITGNLEVTEDTSIQGELTVTDKLNITSQGTIFNNVTPSVQLATLTNKWWESNTSTTNCFYLRGGTSADIGFEVRSSGTEQYLDVHVDGKVYVNEGQNEVIYDGFTKNDTYFNSAGSIHTNAFHAIASDTKSYVEVAGKHGTSDYRNYIQAWHDTDGAQQLSLNPGGGNVKLGASCTVTNGGNITAANLTSGGVLVKSGETTMVSIDATGLVDAQSFNAKSDTRLKENFQPLTIEKSILDLPTYKFDFINGLKNQIGCKAQDLQEICPEIVMEGEDGMLSIQESKIIYLLLEEVKKLRKEVDELRGE